MQEHTIPNFTSKEISEYFNDLQLEISPQNIQKPTPQIAQQTFETILTIFANAYVNDHLKDNEKFDGQYIFYIHKLFKEFIAELNVRITLRDIILPEPKRFITILSNVVNFSMYRESKRPVYEKLIKLCQEKEEIKEVIEDKIADSLRALENIEIAANKLAEEVAKSEQYINELEEKARNEYKCFRILSTEVQNLKEKKNVESDKESSDQLYIIKAKQEIVQLKAQIVTDPARFFELLNEMKEMLVKEKLQISQLDKMKETLKMNNEYLERKKDEIKILIKKRKTVQNGRQKINELKNSLKQNELELLAEEKTINDLTRRLEITKNKLSNINAKIKALNQEMLQAGDVLNAQMSNLKIQYCDNKTSKDEKIGLMNDYIEKSKLIELKMQQEKKDINESIRILKNELEEVNGVVNVFFNTLSIPFE